MAIATATISIYPYPKGVDNTQHVLYIRGTIAISTGGTYPPGGFPLSWTGIHEIKTIPLNPSSTAPATSGTIAPYQVQIGSSANPPSGYIYFVDGVVGNLHIMEPANGASNNSGPLLEIGGAINNTIVTDTIQFEALFIRE